MTDMSTEQEKFLKGGIEEGSKLYDKLLLESFKDPYGQSGEPESKSVAPKPGFCLKTKDDDGKKVFVNVCTSDGVLKPKDISETQLQEILISGDATKFRVPMAIGDAHKEMDKSGNECSAYDIVINPSFFEKINKSKFFMDFFITLIYEGLDNKHDMKLSGDYVMLKNRKAIGTLQLQTVRTKSTPVIMEMDPTMYEMEKEHLAEQRNAKSKQKGEQIKELSSKRTQKEQLPCIIPEYKIMKEPPEGVAEYIIMEIKLPQMKTSKNLTLDVGEDCVVLASTNERLNLDVELDQIINKEETGAQFNKKTHTLNKTYLIQEHAKFMVI